MKQKKNCILWLFSCGLPMLLSTIIVSPKTALITGITGQDGSYLAELLLKKEYVVHGLRRNPELVKTPYDTDNLADVAPFIASKQLIMHYGDLADQNCIYALVKDIQPDEIYNLGAQSHVSASFKDPAYTITINGLANLHFLEAIRSLGLTQKTKFYQASSAEMFGRVAETPQTEKTPFNPLSPYASSKILAHHNTMIYRQAYGLFACSGILYNHESARRGDMFVTKKITKAVAAIACGEQEYIELGNLDAKRDWGYAPEYVETMWLMLQQETPDDYIIATGKMHTVREFVEEAFKVVGVDMVWKGKDQQEKGYDIKTGALRVQVSPAFYRPLDGEFFIGDGKKAQEKLGWKPKVGFRELVKEIIKKKE